ncbi:MAG: GIY-YIG nuclease family protein [Gammaproteobacteria bacterium]|nr:GIY-YIG nuclease family protein [Gammaproteobacteria bacterium]MDH5344336.1 GIY-YIG nuclease family protein [Gammaproteobacteria bacterium]
MPSYSVYLVECGDGTLYTGIATNVERRIEEHAGTARGARYLRGRGPIRIVFQQVIGDRGLASRIEARVKKLPRADKADAESLPARIRAWLEEFESLSTG